MGKKTTMPMKPSQMPMTIEEMQNMHKDTVKKPKKKK